MRLASFLCVGKGFSRGTRPEKKRWWLNTYRVRRVIIGCLQYTLIQSLPQRLLLPVLPEWSLDNFPAHLFCCWGPWWQQRTQTRNGQSCQHSPCSSISTEHPQELAFQEGRKESLKSKHSNGQSHTVCFDTLSTWGLPQAVWRLVYVVVGSSLSQNFSWVSTESEYCESVVWTFQWALLSNPQ